MYGRMGMEESNIRTEIVDESRYNRIEMKKEIIKEIMSQVFGNLSESELIILDSSIQFILDNKLVKKRGILKKGLSLASCVVSTILRK
jgi:hypothetical protein